MTHAQIAELDKHNCSGLNLFADPNAVYSQFGRLILGYDNTSNGAGVLRNLPTWNVDMQVSKEFTFRFGRAWASPSMPSSAIC